ncbi:MAG: hypothetical protein MGU50_07855 [Trichodesmium sp. MAG_R02]|nr:hypothetical protein [Trichodesmium sp. MAG_R02]
MPSPLVEAGIEQQAYLDLYRFHEAVTILGYRRRLYIIFSGILGAFSWVVLAKWVRD